MLKYCCKGWGIPVNLSKSESQKLYCCVMRLQWILSSVNPNSFFYRSKLPGSIGAPGINFCYFHWHWKRRYKSSSVSKIRYSITVSPRSLSLSYDSFQCVFLFTSVQTEPVLVSHSWWDLEIELSRKGVFQSGHLHRFNPVRGVVVLQNSLWQIII